MNNADTPAMPLPLGTETTEGCQGLTKREMMAMNIARGLVNGAIMPSVRSDMIAQVAVSLADALLIELSYSG